MEKPRVRLLVVDDEEHIRHSLKVILAARDYEVDLAASGEEALELAVAHPPDLVILDLCLPGISGIEVCRELRAWLTAPILVLSVTVREADKIAVLDQGADDYLTKPYSISELQARVRALLRRVSAGVNSLRQMTCGCLSVDFTRRRVEFAGAELKLTPKEYEILAPLMRHADCVVTNRTIMDHVWGPSYADDMQTLRVHISNLRRKVEPHPNGQQFIKNEPRVGYRFISESHEE